MKKKAKPKNSTRRNFLKHGLSIGTVSLSGAGLLSSCAGGEVEESGEKVKVLMPDGSLAEVEAGHIHEGVKVVSNEEARKGDPNKEYVMVIDLARCRNARKCVESCQSMHHLPVRMSGSRYSL